MSLSEQVKRELENDGLAKSGKGHLGEARVFKLPMSQVGLSPLARMLTKKAACK